MEARTLPRSFCTSCGISMKEREESKITPKLLACSCHLLKDKGKAVWQERVKNLEMLSRHWIFESRIQERG